jgi:hypothetical protein
VSTNQTVDARILFGEIIKGQHWEKAEADRLATYKTAYERVLTEFSSKLDARLEDFEEKNAELSEANANIKREVDEQGRHSLTTKEAWAAWVSEAKQEAKDIKSLYETFTALNSSGEYWREREYWSRISSAGAFGAFATAAGVTGWFLVHYALTFKVWLVGPDGKIDLGAVLLLSPLVVIVLWLFRMVARLYTVGITETVDAGQRRVMLRTFLALMKDPNSKVTDAERVLILQALFRANAEKDDAEGMPASVFEAAIKAMQSKA